MTQIINCTEINHRKTRPIRRPRRPKGIATRTRRISSPALGGVVVGLPVPARSGLAELDVNNTFWSTKHWRRLLRGYSGYYPPSYPATRDRLNALPQSVSVGRVAGAQCPLLHRSWRAANGVAPPRSTPYTVRGSAGEPNDSIRCGNHRRSAYTRTARTTTELRPHEAAGQRTPVHDRLYCGSAR